MNAMEVFFWQPWVERLGWTLVHFLWQGLAIAAVYAVARRGLASRENPNARYLLACCALAFMMSAPLVTWYSMRPADGALDAFRIHGIAASAPAAAALSAWPASFRARVSNVGSTQFLSWVVLAWMAGAAVFWVRLAGGWLVAARMRSMLVRPPPPEWQVILGKLGARIGVSRPVRLLVSALVQVPVVIGWLRPVVLVPVGALDGLAAEHLEALLLHELAHIRRYDYLVNIVQSIAEALLFYHPAVWWVSAHIRSERELCCDDIAVAASGDALTYARALAQLESCRPALLRAALAASGGSLAGRIARLLGQRQPTLRIGLGPGVLAIALLLGIAAYGLYGQSNTHPAFTTISIQRNSSAWSERFRHPMGLGVNSSLLLMIQFAYAAHNSPDQGHSLPLPVFQIVGGPDWINSDRYDIQAKPGANADPKQFWQRWQKLLADRFQLRLHRETRDLPAYQLTAAQHGLRVPAPAEGVGCVSFPPGTKPHPVPGKVDCGYIAGPNFRHAGLLHIEGSRVHMSDLIQELATVTGRPVLDRTGFAGAFDLKLSFRADEATKGLPGELRSAESSKGPDIFAALEQQLGLKLRAARAPVEVLVIDHAERPRAN